ncbi:MAG: hypothetical protein WC389_18250 [Lutibacter sp.]|jgi:hypothetical protein
MNQFTQTLIGFSTPPDMVDEQTDGTIYMAWRNEEQSVSATECMICKIEKTAITGGFTYDRKFPNGSMNFAFPWADRATLTYDFKK